MKIFTKKRIKTFLISGFAVIITLFVVAYFVINLGLNTPPVKDKITQLIYTNTSIKLDSYTLRFSFFPKPCLKLESLNFLLNENTKLNIKQIKVGVALKSIFTGNINVDKILINNPSISLLDNSKQKTESADKGFILPDDTSSLADTIFSFLPDKQNSITLIIKNMECKLFNNMNGTLLISRKNGHIKLNTSITDLRIGQNTLKPLKVNQFLGIDTILSDLVMTDLLLEKDGFLSAALSLKNGKIISPIKKTILHIPDITSNFSLNNDHYKASIKPVRWEYPEAVIGVFFEYNKKLNNSSIKFTGKEINVEQANLMATTLFKTSPTVSTLFDILLAGNVPNIEVNLKGTDMINLFESEKIVLQGNLKNGHIKIPNTELITTETDGIVKLEKGILDISIEQANLKTTKIKTGHLEVDLLNYEDTPFKGEFQLDTDLSMVPATLISLLPDTVLANELELVENISGRADTTLNLLLDPGDDEIEVKVKTREFKATGNYERIPGDIRLDSLKFTYNNDKVLLNDLTGLINYNHISNINAEIDLKDLITLEILTGSGDLVIENLFPWLMSYERPNQLFSPIKKASGVLSFLNLKLKGPVLYPEKWTYSADGSGKNINLAINGSKDQITGLSGQFTLSQDVFSLDKTNMKIHDLSCLDSYIEKKNLSSVKTPLFLTNTSYKTNSKKTFLKSDITFSSGPEFHIHLSGRNPKKLKINTLKLRSDKYTDATISRVWKRKKTGYVFKGKLTTATLKKMLKPGSYLAKKLRGFTGKHPLYLYSSKDNIINVLTRYLNLDPLFTGNDNKKSNHPTLHQKISLKTDKLKIKKFNISNFDSIISLSKNRSDIRVNNAKLCELRTGGYLKITRNNISANFPFEAVNKPDVNQLLSCFFNTKKLMDGAYSLKMILKGSGSKKDFTKKINGSFKYDAKKGRIYKFTLLSRILSVLNLSKIFQGEVPDIFQEGFAYDSFILEADIKNSRLYLTKAIIDGEDMALIFSGWVDPLNDKMELTCLVAPFKTIDVIVKYIPIVNTILGGRLVTVPVQATGSLSDPQVIPLHPSAVAKGLVDLMSGILKAPVNILDDMIGETGSESSSDDINNDDSNVDDD